MANPGATKIPILQQSQQARGSTRAFVGLLVALPAIVAADIVTTDVNLAHGAIETTHQMAAWQQRLGLPLWSVVYFGAAVVIAVIGAVLWFGMLWLQRDAAGPVWLLWATRLLFLAPLFVWEVVDLYVVCQNVLVLLHTG